MIFNLFNVFRDRQITNKILKREYTSENIQVLKSRNIKEDGSGTIKIDNYDSYIDKETANKLSV
ncbi:hypothetical protein JIY74_27145 [Vibrio harveyi]|nr:hypothetical protein [Vibrio harveyi]